MNIMVCWCGSNVSVPSWVEETGVDAFENLSLKLIALHLNAYARARSNGNLPLHIRITVRINNETRNKQAVVVKTDPLKV